ncbi:sulfite exporter TauE/SafE family protein [Azospirillum halopraeferens]|uniref:sulfite exporter TauE/SafE family protein n=1 Tax=Azospirillum halopraeferens TaxID=34010 RepID=UPI00040C7198|nr:sulfite exporter TauE/SafE family protein [Azospirillum halopraeferens]
MPFDPLSLALFGLVLLIAGVSAGVLAGLLGVGGGIVIVPVLFHLLGLIGVEEHVKMHLAVGTSLASIIPTSISSIRSHIRRDSVDRDLLRSWAPWVALGVLVGTVLAGAMRGAVLTAVFAVVALAVAVHMTVTTQETRLSDTPPRGVFKGLTAATIGAFSAMMGIGGGTLTVPTLVLCNYPIRRAVGTSAALGLIIAVPGSIGFIIAGLDAPGRPPLSLGYVSLLGLLLIAPVSMLTAPLGARLAHSLDPRNLRRAFAFFLGLTSLRMFYGLLT